MSEVALPQWSSCRYSLYSTYNDRWIYPCMWSAGQERVRNMSEDTGQCLMVLWTAELIGLIELSTGRVQGAWAGSDRPLPSAPHLLSATPSTPRLLISPQTAVAENLLRQLAAGHISNSCLSPRPATWLLFGAWG